MRPALPLSVQLLLTFVGLLTGITAVLTTAAYTSLRDNLEIDARRAVTVATASREQNITQIFQVRQQRAEAFLASVQSMCTEPLGAGRVAWLDECVRPMVDDFRRGERAIAAVLTHGVRRLRRSGERLAIEAPSSGALARAIRGPDGTVRYGMQARRGELTLMQLFDDELIARLFAEASSLGPDGELSLVGYDGHVLARTGIVAPSVAGPFAAAFLKACQTGADAFVGPDYQGLEAFQSFRPLPVLGNACVAARVGYEEALAPAERLRRELVTRGAWFVLVGAILSLVAAQWISAPVRRLAVSARALQTGRFDRPIPLAGPSEVRALGRAFNAMGNDLAELVAKEQAARREAEAANRSKDEFLATVSHELRTPLTAILGWAHMLRTERLPPENVQHAIEVIERAARAQRRLIEDLLDVSRIVSNRLHIAREPVRLAEIVQSALDTVRPEAAAQKIQIETQLADSVVVLGDARRLEQVVWNLAWNAVKFTPPSGRINVRLARAGKQVVLTVADTGIGISSAFLPNVFEWFRQADGRSRSQSGLGLGLGIVRHLVRLHGGSVRAESRGEGHGATFVVTLPVHQPESTVAADVTRRETVRPTTARLKDVRVLLVEDDEDTRELVRLTLEGAGAQVEAVASAMDARRELDAEPRDVLISDIKMPEENGYSLIQSLRSAGVSVPAIALTALARREDADAARAAGFQLHIPKPIDATGLIEAVARLVESATVH
jgi:signal transduction histidine kinase/ActR/RegA family two-component response regulator